MFFQDVASASTCIVEYLGRYKGGVRGKVEEYRRGTKRDLIASGYSLHECAVPGK